MKENLNIAWWHERMMLTALARFKTQKEAAEALGVSDRTLIRMKKEYNERQSKSNRQDNQRL